VNLFLVLFYPPSQKTTGLPVDECMFFGFGAMSPQSVADNRGVAKGEDG
jgi:hypothetical protein